MVKKENILMSMCNVSLNNCLKNYGYKSILEVPKKLPKINPNELRFEFVENKPWLVEDKTINPQFIKELLETKGTLLERATQITEKMLEKMGYKPNIVKVRLKPSKSAQATFIDNRATLYVHENLDNNDLVPIIRHELAHMEQYFAILEKYGDKGLGHRTNLSSCNFKKNYLNAESYKKGLENYGKVQNDNLYSIARYYNNPLEKNAFEIEDIIRKIINPNYKRKPLSDRVILSEICKIMNNHNIHKSDMSKTFYKLARAAEKTIKSSNDGNNLSEKDINTLCVTQAIEWLRAGITKPPKKENTGLFYKINNSLVKIIQKLNINGNSILSSLKNES